MTTPPASPRDRLLQAAETLTDEGLEWTWSTRVVSEEAGLPVNAFHRQFENRKAFVEALVARWREESLEAGAGSGSAEERLYRFLRWAYERRSRILFLAGESVNEHGRIQLTPELLSVLPPIEDIRSAIERRTDRNDLSDEEVHAAVLAGIGLLAHIDQSSVLDEGPDDLHFDRLWSMLWRLVIGTESPDSELSM